MRLLGVKIANGYSSEAHVFASLIGHRAGAYDALILYHDWSGDRLGAGHFAEAARAPLVRIDTGWRPNPDGRRSVALKVLSHLRFRAALPAMARAARRYDPDIIYSSQQKWDCRAATYLARRLRRPHLIHLHYTVGPWLGNDVLGRLRACDHVVAVSRFIRHDALRHGVAPQRVSTIPNPVTGATSPVPGTRAAVRDELGVPQGAPLLGVVARLDASKGQHDVISVFAQVAPRYPAAQLVIVGSGPARKALEAQAAETGLAGRIRFTGQRSDVPRILAALDVFIHPSRREPFGLAMAEASAAGLPVLAYAEGGTPEVVTDGVTGLLAPAGDRERLAACLTALLDDPAAARRMGSAGQRQMSERFGPAAAAATFAALLGKVAGT